jgi:hypothetical protein
MLYRMTYSVTFEFDLRPPLTHRGTVEATGIAAATARAARAAHKTLRPINWTSAVVVLLDRAPAPLGADARPKARPNANTPRSKPAEIAESSRDPKLADVAP